MKCPVHADEDLVCAVAADLESSLLSKQISQRDERIKELEAEVERFKAELIGDKTHIPCGIFEENQRKKLERFEAQNSVMKEALEAIIKHQEFIGGNMKHYSLVIHIAKDALSKVSKP